MDKILIAVPTTDYIHARFIESLMALHDHLTAENIRHEIALEAGTLVVVEDQTAGNPADDMTKDNIKNENDPE